MEIRRQGRPHQAWTVIGRELDAARVRTVNPPPRRTVPKRPVMMMAAIMVPPVVRQRSTAAASDDVVKPRNLMLSIGGHCSADFTGGPRRWTRHACAPGAIRTTMRSGRSC